jgi:hypothetical protein
MTYEGQKTCRRYASALGEVIGKVREGWPDGSDTVAEEVARLDAKNGSPHRRDECTQNNDGIAAVGAEYGPNQHRKGHVVCRSHLTSQGKSSRADQEAEEDDRDGLTSSETQRHNGRNSRSQGGREHIACPICPIILGGSGLAEPVRAIVHHIPRHPMSEAQASQDPNRGCSIVGPCRHPIHVSLEHRLRVSAVSCLPLPWAPSSEGEARLLREVAGVKGAEVRTVP